MYNAVYCVVHTEEVKSSYIKSIPLNNCNHQILVALPKHLPYHLILQD